MQISRPGLIAIVLLIACLTPLGGSGFSASRPSPLERTQSPLIAANRTWPDPAAGPASDPGLPLEQANRIVIKLKAAPASFGIGTTGYASLDALTARYGVRSAGRLFNPGSGNPALKRKLGLDRTYVLVLADPGDLQEALGAFAADPAVEAAAIDQSGSGAGFPDDSLFAGQWNLDNSGQTGGAPDADIDAPEAWEITTGSSATLLAILDTGIDLDHPDLAGKIEPGYDFVNGDDDPQDDHGHGTHVAGISAAWGNNAAGVAGVCWQCRLLPLKVLGSKNDGLPTWWANAVEYAVDHGADVINMSLGTQFDLFFLHDAIRYAYESNVPVVAAMMNSGDETIYYPAAYPETIAVGSIDHAGLRSGFSTYGDHIDLIAPGTDVLSTSPDGEYAVMYGTSMATPHVSGVLGLVHALHPGYSVEELRAILAAAADDLTGPPEEDTPGWDRFYGAGRLNAARALASIPPGSDPVKVSGLSLGGPVEGQAGASYTFTATTSPATAILPVTYRWEAAGQELRVSSGGLSSTASYAWSQAGTYAILVTASNGYGEAKAAHTIQVHPASPPSPVPAPQAAFSASPASGPAPLQVSFANSSQGEYSSCAWDFGDGATSTTCEPVHIYSQPGVYAVTLMVSGPGGTSTLTRPGCITVTNASTPPQASFTATPSTGLAPLLVRFTNTSNGVCSQMWWDFGDGSGSDQANPSHTYPRPGVYPVTLTLYGAGGPAQKTAVVTVLMEVYLPLVGGG